MLNIVRILENADQNNFEYGHFLRSEPSYAANLWNKSVFGKVTDQRIVENSILLFIPNLIFIPNLAEIYLLKVNNENIRIIFKIRSMLTVNNKKRRNWSCSGAFIVNFEHILHIVLVFPLLTLKNQSWIWSYSE